MLPSAVWHVNDMSGTRVLKLKKSVNLFSYPTLSTAEYSMNKTEKINK